MNLKPLLWLICCLLALYFGITVAVGLYVP